MISHYEIAINTEEFPNQIVLKRYLLRQGDKVKEDEGFIHIFSLDAIEHPRELLRRRGYSPLPRQSEDEPEIWMKPD